MSWFKFKNDEYEVRVLDQAPNRDERDKKEKRWINLFKKKNDGKAPDFNFKENKQKLPKK